MKLPIWSARHRSPLLLFPYPSAGTASRTRASRQLNRLDADGLETAGGSRIAAHTNPCGRSFSNGKREKLARPSSVSTLEMPDGCNSSSGPFKAECPYPVAPGRVGYIPSRFLNSRGARCRAASELCKPRRSRATRARIPIYRRPHLMPSPTFGYSSPVFGRSTLRGGEFL